MQSWPFIASLSLARMSFGFQFQTIASLGPELSQRFGLGYAALGTLIGAYMLPGAVAALPLGLLGRRFGARRVVGSGLALMTLGAVLPVLWFDAAGIGVGRVVSGLGAVALIVMQGQMVSQRFSGRRFMLVMGLLVGAFPVGVGLVGLLLPFLADRGGAPSLLLVGAGCSALALILFLPSAQDAVAVGPRWQLPSWTESRLVILAGLVWTAFNAGYYGFLSYVPSLLAARGHPETTGALVLALATWFSMPASLVGSWTANRAGNGPVFVFGMLAGMTALIGPAVLDWPLVWGIVFGTVASVHASVILAIGTFSARPENRAVGMGMFYTAYYVGGAVFPAVCGAAADASGTPAGALVAAAALTSLAFPAYLLHRHLARDA